MSSRSGRTINTGQFAVAKITLKDPSMREDVIDFYLKEYYAKYSKEKNLKQTLNDLSAEIENEYGDDDNILYLPLYIQSYQDKDLKKFGKVYYKELPEYKEAIKQIQNALPDADEVFAEGYKALDALSVLLQSYNSCGYDCAGKPSTSHTDKPKDDKESMVNKSEEAKSNVTQVDNASKSRLSNFAETVPSPDMVMNELKKAQDTQKGRYYDIYLKYNEQLSLASGAPSKTEYAELKAKSTSLERHVRELENTIAQKETKIKGLHKDNEDKQKVIEHEKNANRELTRINQELSTTLDSTKNKLEDSIKANKIYTTHLVLNPPALTNLSRIVNNVFESYAKAENLLIYTADTPLRNQNDDFNYYLSRVQAKFAEQIKGCKYLEEWSREMNMASLVGMIPVSGRVYKLFAQAGGSNEAVSTIARMLYTDVFKTLIGAIVVMCDEMSYLMPIMVEGFRPNDVFKNISDSVLDCAKQLGYKIYYIKPFEKLTAGTAGFKNGKFAPESLKLEPLQVFEVLKLGVSYGTNEEITEVSAAK